MDHLNQNIYEELLGDSRFVLWALGKNKVDDVYWEYWKNKHPNSLHQFEEACRTVKMLKFNSPGISSKEVLESWRQTKKKMKLRPARQLFSGAVSWYRRIASVLIFPLLILSIWFFYNQQHLKFDFRQFSEYGQKRAIRVVAPLGGQLEVELPDGSRAWLNSGSEINYPAYFTHKRREIEMTGEVYFQVSRSNEMFVVKSPGPTIKVYGTEFNVHAYPTEKEITVTLAKGKVALENDGKELMMDPGEVAVFDKTNGHVVKQETDIYPYTCWRDGKYIFRDALLGSILKTLERSYNVSIHLEDLAMSQFRYDATINGEPLEQILDLLTFSAPLRYEFRRSKVEADGSYSKAEVRLWRDVTKIINPQK